MCWKILKKKDTVAQLLTEVVDSQSLEVLENHSDVALRDVG